MTPENGHTIANHLCLPSNIENGSISCDGSKLPLNVDESSNRYASDNILLEQKKHVHFHLQNCRPLLIFRYDIIKCITTIKIYWVWSWSSRAFVSVCLLNIKT